MLENSWPPLWRVAKEDDSREHKMEEAVLRCICAVYRQIRHDGGAADHIHRNTAKEVRMIIYRLS